MRLSVIALFVMHVVLSSENKTEFKSINEKSKIWNCLKNLEEDILVQFAALLRSNAAYEVFQKETCEKLKDLHEHDEQVALFLDRIANRNSIVVAQVFNDNFLCNKRIATESLEYKAIAFKAVEMYYLKALQPILEKHNLKMNPAGRLILAFLSDHRGFGPGFGIAYIPPSCHKNREKLLVAFDALITAEALLIKILPWLAHRYLEADFGVKLSKMVENIDCKVIETRMETPFCDRDLKYVENLNLIQIFAPGKNHKDAFDKVVGQEIKDLFRKLGNIEVRNVFVGVGNQFVINYKKQK